jgi:hypothetical protein
MGDAVAAAANRTNVTNWGMGSIQWTSAVSRGLALTVNGIGAVA